MKLYSMRGSRYGARCLIQMSAKGLDAPVELVPLPVPESFRAINPLMLVPVLETEGGHLPEAQVICDYIEELHPSPSLLPETPWDRARMRLMIRLFELYYDPAALSLYRLRKADAARDAATVEGALNRMRDALALIAARLDGGAYAIGGKLSLADCALMPPFLQASMIFPHLGLPNPAAENARIADYFAATRDAPHVGPVLDAIADSLAKAFGKT